MPECPVSVDCQGAHGAAGKFQDLDLFDPQGPQTTVASLFVIISVAKDKTLIMENIGGLGFEEAP